MPRDTTTEKKSKKPIDMKSDKTEIKKETDAKVTVERKKKYDGITKEDFPNIESAFVKSYFNVKDVKKWLKGFFDHERYEIVR